MLPRLLQALQDLGIIGGTTYSESASVTVTNLRHITIGIRSDRALEVITEALEEAVKRLD
jgi:hypothetical protein